ncbi:MAG: hypothetical protein K2K89_01885 [Ruminococcus sp.]|nr:hypothetical protein [Alistipes senegalensis]MDE6424875.1 hypothetical protein [Ruminococcus sp.]
MKKNISVLLAFTLCLFTNPQIQANASDFETISTVSTTETNVSPLAEGLIESYFVYCSGGSKTLYLTAYTEGSEIMGKIGFKNIAVQRSSDNKSWTTETTISEDIVEDVATHSIDNYAISVTGGYYYRVKLTHYAKEQTWFFPNSQSVDNTSSSVWIS